MIRTKSSRPLLTIPSTFITSTWNVKEPTHYSRRIGREVPGVVAVLCESMGGLKERMYLPWDIKSHSYINKIGRAHV